MLAFLKTVFAFFMSLFQIIAPISPELAGGADKYFESFSADTVYTSEYAAELEKQPGKDFVVLSITDVQLYDIEANGEYGELAEKTIDKLVADVNPDLITMTGDNAWGSLAYVKLIEKLDSYGIPWAPVMGNHDGQGLISEFWAAYRFYKAENCLFKFGPEDMGYGNYIINITENGKVIHTLFMMDTHSDADFTNEDGTKVSGYDHLWKNQFEWYKWAVEGIASTEGKLVESTLFMHIPVYEYKLAWEEADYDAESGTYLNPAYADSFGSNNEPVCSPPVNTGFFAVCKELGSTKNIVCGHDHINDSSIVYDGIRLTYGVKTGAGCYWETGKNGGTTVSINSDGAASIAHIYVDPQLLGFDF